MREQYDVTVIGGGPAGLAAALAAAKAGASTLLVEREARLGGILKQCVHDGFGLLRFGEKLAGPEYAGRFIAELPSSNVELALQTFVDSIRPQGEHFALTLVSRAGISNVLSKTLLLATGCRERTARQIGVHGTRPAGVFSAGTAQYYTNMLGKLPAKRCVILGSGDIGLIMARRLTLEGAQVLGVYEAKSIPSGLPRNIAQCLEDFDIPLHLQRTVTRVFGHERLEAVEISAVDAAMRPLPGTQEIIACDALILSVGLIPENELAETLGVALHPATKGPLCDQNGMTTVPGVFSCGNAAHVNDLVDYVSESGEAAGIAAAHYSLRTRQYAAVKAGEGFLYAMPQRIDLSEPPGEIPLFFRTKEELGATRVRVFAGERQLLEKRYRQLRPPEMERLAVNLTAAALAPGDALRLEMEGIV
ncbi:MAG: NAD(P)/FAD-dependent oxidoreductase [Oscillospiraceae bacterium]|jgi:thioredoxin reductase|nr:NAD(P)/FAD-dependent oxidoreductase [Oscillospiraceae bacterium]